LWDEIPQGQPRECRCVQRDLKPANQSAKLRDLVSRCLRGGAQRSVRHARDIDERPIEHRISDTHVDLDFEERLRLGDRFELLAILVLPAACCLDALFIARKKASPFRSRSGLTPNSRTLCWNI